MSKFELLKQVFYNSEHDRYCDGYKIIIDKLSSEQRKKLGIKDSDLQEIIRKGERYLYRVAKENGKFKYLAISLNNFKIIREHYKYFGENE